MRIERGFGLSDYFNLRFRFSSYGGAAVYKYFPIRAYIRSLLRQMEMSLLSLLSDSRFFFPLPPILLYYYFFLTFFHLTRNSLFFEAGINDNNDVTGNTSQIVMWYDTAPIV